MCNFRFIAFRLNQLCGTELVRRLRCSFPVLFPGLPVMLILWSGCSPRSLQTGPGRRPGRTGPHIQPRDGLRPAQHQRDARRRRPGHMKATRSAPVLLLSPLLPPPPQSSSMSLAPPPSALGLHAIAKMQGEKEGCGGRGEQRSTHSFVSPSSQNSQPVPRPLFSAPPPSPPFLLHLAITPEGTIFFPLLHMRLSVM